MIAVTGAFLYILFSRYLVLDERHFSSDILVPFPDSSNWCVSLLIRCAVLELFLSRNIRKSFFTDI